MRIDGEFKIYYGEEIVPRDYSVIDWIQSGIVEVEIIGLVRNRKYRKYGEYVGVIPGLDKICLFDNTHIVE